MRFFVAKLSLGWKIVLPEAIKDPKAITCCLLVEDHPHPQQLSARIDPMPPRCAMRFESHTPKLLATRKQEFIISDAKPSGCLNSQEKCHKNSPENPAMLACDAKNQHVFRDRAMRNACNSDSGCGLACNAGARNAKSLAMRVDANH